MTIFTPSLTSPADFFSRTATIALEKELQQTLAPHTLMDRAGASVSRLAQAIAPHARTVWIACGPGNNGGDGLIAALRIRPWVQAIGGTMWVSFTGDETSLPDDAKWAMHAAKSAGIEFSFPPPGESIDLGVDALLGIGIQRTPHLETNLLPAIMTTLRKQCATLLCVDTPSDLDAFTGSPRWPNGHINPNRQVHTLTLLTLKPGLTTGLGRDFAGSVWLDPLQPAPSEGGLPTGRWLPPATAWPSSGRPHASHKGTHGDVWVLGGQTSPNGPHMLGAIVLAGRSALCAGAGRVTLVPASSNPGFELDPVHPELMISHQPTPASADELPKGTWIAGCGGGDAVKKWLPCLLASTHPMVLDADALNQIATDKKLRDILRQRRVSGAISVLTPHPLEAARLLGTTTESIQNNRLTAASQLSDTFQCICVLKGSGTIVSAPDSTPWINGTGNARLATAGTGDVLAGLLGGVMAGIAQLSPMERRWKQALDLTLQAVHAHGLAADQWPKDHLFAAANLPEQAGFLLHNR